MAYNLGESFGRIGIRSAGFRVAVVRHDMID